MRVAAAAAATRSRSARAFTGRDLVHPYGLQCVDERLEVAVETLEIAGDRVLRDVSLDRRERDSSASEEQRQRSWR
jgi:hypothetical protein